MNKLSVNVKLDKDALASVDAMVGKFETADWSAIAAQAYDAYGGVTDHKNFRGDPMPEWDALPAKIQEAWIAAARNVACSAVKIAVLTSLKVGG